MPVDVFIIVAATINNDLNSWTLLRSLSAWSLA